MDSGAAIVVAGAVVALTSLIKWAGLRDTWGPAAIMVLSLLGVGLWGYSQGPTYQRELLFDYFTGWISVATSAAGVFGFTRSIPGAVVTGSPRSVIPGAAQNPTQKPDHFPERREG